MAHHAAPHSPKSRRSALLRAGLAVAAAGAALGAGAGAAQSAPSHAPDEIGIDAPLEGLVPSDTGQALGAVGYVTAPAKDFHLNPLAGTGADPLNNNLGTQVADFKPMSTAEVTAPLTEGNAVRELPLAGTATGLLPG